jgi:hypothetical protein
MAVPPTLTEKEEKLTADMRAGLIKQIVIWRLDRLGRTSSGLVHLLDELRDRRVDLVSLRDGALDPTTPTGRLIYTILSSVATYETEVRKEPVRLSGISSVQTWRRRYQDGPPARRGAPGRRAQDPLCRGRRQERAFPIAVFYLPAICPWRIAFLPLIQGPLFINVCPIPSEMILSAQIASDTPSQVMLSKFASEQRDFASDAAYPI